MTPETAAQSGPIPPSWVRWPVLAAFGLLVAATQLLWLTFAPITTQAHEVLGVSAGAIGDLAAIQPVLFVALAIPAGRWTDRSFATALSVGAVLTAVGAGLRLVDPGAYGWILAGQFLVAVGQPLVLNATTAIPVRFFPPAERTTAIAVGTASQFVGILAAALTGEPLFRAGGLALLFGVQAFVAGLAALAVLVAVRTPATFAAVATRGSLGWLRQDRVLWALAGLLFVGVGVFNALATWLDAILTGLGTVGVAGPLIAITTLAGILGATVLPPLAARYGRRRELLLATTSLTAVVFLGIAVAPHPLIVGILLAAEGFVLMAGMPVALDWSELRVGPGRAATATGFLMLAGNLGGAVLVLVVQLVIGNSYLALVVLSASAIPGVALALRLPSTVGLTPAVSPAGKPG